MKKTEWLGIRMPPELYGALFRLAREEDRSMADTVRVICKTWLKEHGHLGHKSRSNSRGRATHSKKAAFTGRKRRK